MSKFSVRLRELRNARGISQQKLADKVGISKSSINMYERGEREPGLDLVEAFADIFNVDLDYLHGKSNIPNKSLVSDTTPNSLPDDENALLDLYRCLDRDDRAEIRGEMKQMLKAEKYKQDTAKMA